MANECPKCQTNNPEDSKFCKECATPLPGNEEAVHTKTLETPTEELTTGSTFAGRYQIIEELGKGGMGRVYKVLDKQTNEKIALKLIKPEIASDRKTIERFKNELTTARKIRHKNVCGMYYLGEDKGRHYITMEFVSGEDLKSSLRRFGNLPTSKAISIAKQICDGLEEAHSLGIIHRDLKPNNIMIDDNGNARIMDFGIARTIKGKGITGSGIMIGTPEYMSPEQVEAKEVDQRSDIYSLGIIMYEMLTGRLPFEADTPFAIGVKHKSETPKSPKEYNSQISDELSRVILKCLEKDKEDRFQDAGEVRSELEKIEQGLPRDDRILPKKKPVTSREITVQFKVEKLLVPSSVFLVLIAVVLILWSPWKKKTSELIPSDKPSVAILYFRNNTGDQNLNHWREVLCDSLITDLSQSKYIRTVSFDRIYSILKKHNLLEARNYSSEDLQAIAVEGGADYILQGSLSKAEELFRIQYTLQDVNSGNNIGADSLEGRGTESIFTMVDQLTLKIKEDLNFTDQQITDDRDMGVKTITTSSTEAYRYYREGRDLFLRGDLRESIPLLERAVEIDPKFSLAYRGLSTSYSSIDIEKKNEYAVKAYELRDHSSHEEKLVIEAYYASIIEQDDDKSIRACEKIMEEYPDNNFAKGMLASLYNLREDWDNVTEYMRMAINAGDEWREGFGLLGLAYESKGEYEKAREVYNAYIQNVTEDAYMHKRLSDAYVYEGRYDDAIREAAQTDRLDPNSYIWGGVYLLRGDFEAAGIEFQNAVETDDLGKQITGIIGLASLYRTLGKYNEALAIIERGLVITAQKIDQASYDSLLLEKSNVQWYMGDFEESLKTIQYRLTEAEKKQNADSIRTSYFNESLAYCGLGQLDNARRSADAFQELNQKSASPKYLRYYHLLQGMIALQGNDFPSAVSLLEKALDLEDQQSSWTDWHGMFVYYLGITHYLAGEKGKAESAFEQILSMTTGRYNYGDLYAKSFYMLGKICEEQSDKSIAIEHYEKFLSLWKDADPGLSEVNDARKRLAGLKQ